MKRNGYPEGFEEFWQVRRSISDATGPKKLAGAQWVAKGLEERAELVIEELLRQIKEKEKIRKMGLFVESFAHAHRWLRDERWDESFQADPHAVTMAKRNRLRELLKRGFCEEAAWRRLDQEFP